MNSRKTSIAAGVVAALLASVSTVQAAPIVDVSDSDGSLFNTESLTGYSTDGGLMDGMEVRTCFDSMQCETATFDGTVGTSTFGEASGTDWSLTADGDTFSNPFTFSSATDNPLGGVTNITINGRPGNTIFDIKGDSTRSTGSALGKPFQLQSSSTNAEVINVEYTDKLSVDGVFYDDLFTRMDIDFNDETFAGSFSFLSDTDNNDFLNDSPITPVDPSPVPEPGTLTLLGAGILGLGMRRRFSRA